MHRQLVPVLGHTCCLNPDPGLGITSPRTKMRECVVLEPSRVVFWILLNQSSIEHLLCANAKWCCAGGERPGRGQSDLPPPILSLWMTDLPPSTHGHQLPVAPLGGLRVCLQGCFCQAVGMAALGVHHCFPGAAGLAACTRSWPCSQTPSSCFLLPCLGQEVGSMLRLGWSPQPRREEQEDLLKDKTSSQCWAGRDIHAFQHQWQ